MAGAVGGDIGLRSSVHTSNCVGERRHSPLTSVIADGWQSVTKRLPYRTAYRTGEFSQLAAKSTQTGSTAGPVSAGSAAVRSAHSAIEG
jgi:hypothetical protein